MLYFSNFGLEFEFDVCVDKTLRMVQICTAFGYNFITRTKHIFYVINVQNYEFSAR